jgi:hypothetical protein
VSIFAPSNVVGKIDMSKRMQAYMKRPEAGAAYMADKRGVGADLRADKRQVERNIEATRKLLLRLKRKHPGGDPYAVPMVPKVMIKPASIALTYAQTGGEP